MLGSTFIAAQNPDDLKELEIDDLDDFRHCSLEALTTLDFELALQGSGIRWTQGQPVVHDEEAGLIVFQVNPIGLQAVLAPSSPLRVSHPDDISVLREFVDENGAANIHELVTF